MKLTEFEINFLQIKSLEKGFNPLVIRCFHSLLIKADNKNPKKWTHDLLRNYINVSYKLCSFINTIEAQKQTISIKKAEQTNGDRNEEQVNDEEDKKKPINIYEEQEPEKAKDEGDGENKDGNKKPCLKVFFTGLYTPDLYCGQKNGLYFVHNGDKNIVMTREEILKTSEFNGTEVLNKINHRDSYENVLPIDKLYIDKANVKKPEVIMSSEANNNTPSYHWLHILRKGIDNIPDEFVKSFFNRRNIISDYYDEYNKRKKDINECIKSKNGSFECYQEILIESINQQIDNCKNFPTIFHIDKDDDDKECKPEFQYLMPVYLLNSDKPDFCIILGKKDKDKGKDGETRVWEPITSLNMDEAYCDILVFGTDAVRRVDWW